MSFWDSIGDFFGGGSQGEIQQETKYAMPKQLPGYAESDSARGDWYNTLNKWGSQPGYGAIQPDWNSIWENAKRKVTEYYRGGPAGPGAIAQVDASNARRNVSENPAGDTMKGRLSMNEGNSLQDIAVNQAIQEAQIGEKGRTDWLSSIMQLSGLKPQYNNPDSMTTRTGYGPSPTSGLGTSIFKNLATGGGKDWMGLISQFLGGGNQDSDAYGIEDSGLGDAEAEKDDGYDWLSALMGGGRILAGDPVGGGTQLAGTFF